MTIQEKTGYRDLTFSKWIREKLPDSSTGFLVSDLDFILENWKTKKIMLIEVKTNNGLMRKGQSMLFKNLDRWLRNGIDNEWQYYGFHLIQLSNNNPVESDIMFDGFPITESDLIRKLSLC